MPYTRHTLDLVVLPPQSTQSNQQQPNKEQLRSNTLNLRAQRKSYREIAQMVGVHWTRIHQIVKSEVEVSSDPY